MMKKIAALNLISVLALVVIVVIGWKSLSLWSQRQKVNREIAVLSEQKQSLQGKNQQIEESLRYLNTQSYKDQLARQQDLQHPGEIVINLPDNLGAQAESGARSDKARNPALWWKYFFDK